MCGIFGQAPWYRGGHTGRRWHACKHMQGGQAKNLGLVWTSGAGAKNSSELLQFINISDISLFSSL